MLGRAVGVVVALARGLGVGEDGVAVGRGVGVCASIGTTSLAEGAETRAPGVASIPTKLLDDGALTRALANGVAVGPTTDG